MSKALFNDEASSMRLRVALHFHPCREILSPSESKEEGAKRKRRSPEIKEHSFNRHQERLPTPPHPTIETQTTSTSAIFGNYAEKTSGRQATSHDLRATVANNCHNYIRMLGILPRYPTELDSFTT
uniref:Uncharacterized protein n=1 Tax=Lutzomyia longipalpis TaxID=7200 RepID=A0A1B0C874_LUTLO